MATTAHSSGRPSSATVHPTAGESSATTSPTRLNWPRRSLRSSVMSPMEISSSTRCASRSVWSRAASTPMSGPKSQALRGSTTRAITRFTPNSKRPRPATTRLVSSAPVTAARTSTLRIPARSSTRASVPDPCTTVPAPSRPTRRVA